MGRHALSLRGLVDEEKKGFLLSSHTSCMWEQDLGPSVYFSDRLLRNLLSFLPECLHAFGILVMVLLGAALVSPSTCAELQDQPGVNFRILGLFSTEA